jgi:hypothetical protein
MSNDSSVPQSPSDWWIQTDGDSWINLMHVWSIQKVPSSNPVRNGEPARYFLVAKRNDYEIKHQITEGTSGFYKLQRILKDTDQKKIDSF